MWLVEWSQGPARRREDGFGGPCISEEPEERRSDFWCGVERVQRFGKLDRLVDSAPIEWVSGECNEWQNCPQNEMCKCLFFVCHI